MNLSPFPIRLNTTARGWLLVAPALIIFLVFYVGPAIIGLRLSFFQWDGISPTPAFVGIDNYVRLAQDGRFWNAVVVNLTVLLVSLFFVMPLALLIAISLTNRGLISGLFRTVIFLPQVLSVATIALVWTLLYDPYQGLLNHLLNLAGLRGVPWLGERGLALVSVMLVIVWSSLGFHVVLFLAGLANIPREFYDAASLETSNKFDVLRFITIPLLRETVFIAFVVIVGSSFGHVTGMVFLLTSGGPQNATELIGLYSYTMAFRARDFGYASAISFVLLMLVLLLVWFPTQRIARQRLEY